MSQLLGVIFFIAAIVLAYLYISMKIHVSQQVQDEVIRWRDRELESQKAHIFEVARIDAMAQLAIVLRPGASGKTWACPDISVTSA